MQKYRNVDEAFRAIDVNGSGELSMAEFVEGAKLRVRFTGDVKAIFQSLDMDRSGTIGVKEFRKLRGLKANQEEVEKHQLKTTKDIVAERRLRSPISNPQPHERGVTLLSSGHQPLGEKTSTSAGFYTFHRSPTGRLDRHRSNPPRWANTDGKGGAVWFGAWCRIGDSPGSAVPKFVARCAVTDSGLATLMT